MKSKKSEPCIKGPKAKKIRNRVHIVLTGGLDVYLRSDIYAMFIGECISKKKKRSVNALDIFLEHYGKMSKFQQDELKNIYRGASAQDRAYPGNLAWQ